ncbi:MAG TPA: neutral zinc metallopeptidase [Segeticoccus sp.]|uniref:KPN_02809 family neutral zinc metallopeptidase n=1 Tax=Segeticoccus sp. TaxID=2706531 RepID=UPI002D8010CB|nr:neutral zinc metallopeptidase [Segeticoccus sp.]HET8602224.1 neutral zinc metallopeptidase [Segeticoccus sp.]
MSFNDDANLDTSQVEGGGGGGGFRRGGIAVGGGGGIVALLIYLVYALMGGDTGGGGANAQQPADNGQQQPAQSNDFSRCRTGADANRDVECRVIGTVNSVQDYWSRALPQYGVDYTPAKTVLYSGATQSACGTASNQVGPLYCPLDGKVYIDASFFQELTDRFGADNGALAQEYVVAHEYGHHVQDLLGLLGRAQQDPQGAESASVRTELMADCLAGVWADHASSTKDAQGHPLLKPLTQQDIHSALSAAAAVGDDRIQRAAQGRVTPETWTHGSSAERQHWFLTGYRTGDLNQCDTFSTANLGG